MTFLDQKVPSLAVNSAAAGSSSSIAAQDQVLSRRDPFTDVAAIELSERNAIGTTKSVISKRLPIRKSLTGLIAWHLILLAGIVCTIEVLIHKSKKLDAHGYPVGIFSLPDDGVSALSSVRFFTYKYLPVLFAVIYGRGWRLIDDTIRQTESYVRLYHEDGALGSESLCLDYGHQWATWAVSVALYRRHWRVALSGSIFIITTNVIPTFQAGFFEPIFIPATAGVRARTVIATDLLYGRMTEAMYVAVAIHATLLLVTLNWHGRHTKHVTSSLGDMATLSKLLAEAPPDVRATFAGGANVPGLEYVPANEILARIGHKRFKIVVSEDHHQLVRLPHADAPHNQVPHLPYGDAHSKSPGLMPRILVFPYNYILPVSYTLLLILVLAFFSQKYALLGDQPIYITTIAGFMRVWWYAFYNAYQTMEPWYQLIHSGTIGALAADSVLLHPTANSAAWWKYLFTSKAGHTVLPRFAFAASILGEFLLVTVSGFIPGVPISSPRFIAPLVTSVLLIVLMIGVTCAIAISRGGNGYLPHKPTSPAAVMAYLYGSAGEMFPVGDMQELGRSSARRRNTAFAKPPYVDSGSQPARRFGFGKFQGKNDEGTAVYSLGVHHTGAIEAAYELPDF